MSLAIVRQYTCLSNKNYISFYALALVLIVLLAFSPGIASSQPNLTRAEYFFDSDPGFGNGIAISIPTASVISNANSSADISSLSPGIHQLFIRVKDASGNWSITNRTFF